MKCPFLKDTRVKFCQASPFKKMIVSDQGDVDVEKCSTPSWKSCPVAQQRLAGKEQHEHHTSCPFLQESFVQYCSLSPVTKFIPYNEAPFSRCTNTNHRYCEHYLSMENPESPVLTKTEQDIDNEKVETVKEYNIDGIRMPKKLQYTPNHMWVDESEDGVVHIGVDAFFTKVLGRIDEISFITTKGVSNPTAALTVNGVDLEVIFPKQLLITGMNSYLRTTPEKLTEDPYGAGWLFVGQRPKHQKNGVSLIKGRAAAQWMKLEAERLSAFVHNELQNSKLGGKILMADGGVYTEGLAKHLHRDDLHKLFHKFFHHMLAGGFTGE
jgi:glycine cleavage system H lipoate-binding protein